MLKKYIRSIVLVCSFEHTVKNMNTLEARRYKCIIQSGFFFFFISFFFVCVCVLGIDGEQISYCPWVPTRNNSNKRSFLPLSNLFLCR